MRISDWSSDVCSSDLDGGSHAQQHQQYTKHDGFLLIGRSGATMRWTKAGPGTAMTESATRFRPMVGASIEASGALEVVTTVSRNANGGGFGRARSAERREGKESVRTCRSWWSPSH